jgi:hypothetical protein
LIREGEASLPLTRNGFRTVIKNSSGGETLTVGAGQSVSNSLTVTTSLSSLEQERSFAFTIELKDSSEIEQNLTISVGFITGFEIDGGERSVLTRYLPARAGFGIISGDHWFSQI